MPADGRLFLGVNDDEVTDNPGEFMVDVGPIDPTCHLAQAACDAREVPPDMAGASASDPSSTGCRKGAIQFHRSMPDWKDTLNLPRTTFPMKANLPGCRAGDDRVVERDRRAV